jgi:hypothetical protein
MNVNQKRALEELKIGGDPAKAQVAALLAIADAIERVAEAIERANPEDRR